MISDKNIIDLVYSANLKGISVKILFDDLLKLQDIEETMQEVKIEIEYLELNKKRCVYG